MTSPSDRDLLHRLLGPAEAELGCDACFEHLDVYVDRYAQSPAEADRAVPGLRAHLDGCPACAEDFASLLALAVQWRAP